jgi:alkylation response protein AidB-like acyl-CoA dehydrogenase
VERTLFAEDHELFRQSFRAFVEAEVIPHHAQWERDGAVSRDVWLAAGAGGFLGLPIPPALGGAGVDDFRYSVVMHEELARVGATGPGFTVHNDVVLPYLLQFGTAEQQQRWLPGLASGETIGAIAMTEPGAGSDLAGIRTTAVRQGDHYVVNGQKTFITNGQLNDLVIVAAKTDPAARHRGISLLVVERGVPGYERGRRLEKVGMHAQDTAELFFHDARVPVDNLLGEQGQGFFHLVRNLPQERVSIATIGLASAETTFEQTLAYCRERTAFGQPIGSFQNSRFKLAEMHTELQIGRVFVDRCVEEHCAGRLNAEQAAAAKWWTTALQTRVIDTCVQLHCCYGYMLEYPVAKAFIDNRAQTIYGGTNEIMKEIIGRSLGV